MDRPLDILLVKPGSQKQLYGALSAFDLTAIEPPLWAALLAAFLRSEGFGVDILDAELEGLSYRSTAQRIHEMRPRLTLVTVSGSNPSASTMNMTGAGEILRALEMLSPNMVTALSGLHPSALPERTLREERVNYVIQGEGFSTLAALLRALPHASTLQDIPGLWYRDGGNRICHGPPAPLVENLDTLPAPAWDLLPIEKYRAHNWHCFDDIEHRTPYAVIYTSLGCPFKCSFCCINALFGGPGIRYRSPALVIEEIDTLVRRGVKNIKLIDEMFVLKKSHVEDLCDRIIERGYHLNIWVYARVNTVTAPLLEKMKRAGVSWVAYGFESGSDRVLADVTKGYKPEKTMDVVRMTNDAGLYICANYIFGLPEDDRESMQQTMDLATEINAEWANIYSAMAYPGSALYEQALRDDLPLPATWQGYSQYAYDCLPLPTKYISGAEVLSFRDKAFHRYYTSPRYLEMIEKKFGTNLVQHIQEMTKTRIERKWGSK